MGQLDFQFGNAICVGHRADFLVGVWEERGGYNIVTVLLLRPALLTIPSCPPPRRMRFALSLFFVFWLVVIAVMGPASRVFAQETTAQETTAQETTAQGADAQRQRLMADRYAQLLLRRPRPGTALDRLYAFHATAGTLDEQITEWTPTAEDDTNAGNRWLLIGLLQQRSGAAAAAVEALQYAEQQLPDDPMASFLLGTALQAEGQIQPATAALQRALQRQPTRTEALPIFLALGQLYYQQNQDDDAEQLWSQLEQQFGDDRGIWRRVAQLMVDQQRLQPAIDRYEQLAATSSPQEAVTVRLNIARLKLRMGDADQALADLQALLPQVRPGSWLNEQVQREIESVLLADGGYEKLTQYYAARFQQFPEDVDLGLRLGQAQSQSQQYAAAAKTLGSLLERSPDSVPVREALVEVLARRQDWKGVAEQYAVLAEQQPDHAEYLLQWGTAVLQDDSQTLPSRRAAAARIWLRYAAQRSKDPVAQIQVAERLASIGQQEQAEARFRAAIELAPDDPQYREYLGKFFFENGRREEALTAWNSIAAGPQPDRDSLLRLAEVLTGFGLQDESLDAMAKAAEFDLNLPQRLLFVRRLIAARRFNEALAQWRQAESIAESDIEQQQLWQQRIELAQAAGTLPELIQETQQRVDSAEASPLDALQLATLLAADGRPHDATTVLTDALEHAPQEIELLRRAADLYVQTQRPSQAIAMLRKLADVDPRTRQTSLRRVIDLYLQEGQREDALQLARQLVEAQPDNAALWVQYAELCFQSQQNETGYQALREAVRLSPRDPDVLSQLGSRLAADYRTDEAIEVHWQQWEAVDSSDLRIDAVAALAPLYDRQLRIEQLLDRLRSQPTSRFGDAESITHQIAIAHEVTGNPGAALRTLAPLRIDRPRDSELLQKLIHLAALSEDVEQQLTFYEDLLAVARSVPTEQAYLDLLIRSRRLPDLIRYVEQSARGEQWDSVQRGIDTLAAAKHVDAASTACQQVLTVDPHATAVQLRLIILQLYAQDYQSAAELAKALLDRRQDNAPLDDSTLASMRQIADMATVQSDEWLQLLPQLPAVDSGGLTNLALPLYVIARHRLKQGKTLFQQSVDFDKLLQSSDTGKLWDAYITTLIHYHIHPPASLSLRSTDHREVFSLVCHLATLGDMRARTAAIRVVGNRRDALSSQWRGAANAAGWTFDETQLQWLEQQLSLPLVDIFQDKPAEFLAAVANEFKAAGRPDDALRLVQSTLHPKDITGIAAAVQVASQTGQTDRLLPQLPQWQRWLRDVLADDPLDHQAILDAALQLSQLPKPTAGSTVEQTFNVLTTILAAGAAAERLQPQIQQRWDQPFARVAISTSASTTMRVSPLLGRPLSVATMRLLLTLDEPSGSKLNQLLVAADPAIPEDEQKLRLALASAHQQWARQADRERSLELLRQGIERFPQDAQFRIAFALQAERLQRQTEALEQLELAQPAAPVLVRLKQLSRLRLASYLSDKPSGRDAAEQLQNIPLDSKTKRIVTGQLMRLGLKEQANAFLVDNTRPRNRPTAVESAKRFVDGENPRAAREAAYEALRRGTIREQQQAIKWLADLDALMDVVQYLERRRQDNPNAWQTVDQLAHLYTALGQTQKATALREARRRSLRAQQTIHGDPVAELQAGLDRSARRQFPAAFEHFLNVFAIDAQTMEEHVTPFVQAAQNTRHCDEAFQQLAACDLSGLSFDALRDLLDLDPAGVESPTARGREFMTSLLVNSSVAQLGPLLRELGRSNRLGDQAAVIAAPALRRLFSDPQSFRSDAIIWYQGQPDADGWFTGSLQPIVAAVRSQPKLKQTVLERCEAMQDAPAALPVATTVRALLSSSPEEPYETLSSLLAAEQPQWSGPFAWQAAQLLESREDVPSALIVALYRAAAEDPHLPEAYRWTAGGVGNRLYSHLKKHDQRQAARQWLLKDFDDALAAALSAERLDQRLTAVASRLQQLDCPLDAFRVEDALAYLHGTVRPTPDFDAAACHALLTDAFAAAADSQWDLSPLQAELDQPVWQSSLAAIAVKQLAAGPNADEDLNAVVDRLEQAEPRDALADRLAASGLRALIAMALEQPQAAEAVNSILKQLPSSQDESSQPPTPSADAPPILDLWTVATVAIDDQQATVREAGLRLLSRLLTTAESEREFSLAIVIADRMLATESTDVLTTVQPVLTRLLESLPDASPTSLDARIPLATVAARRGLPELALAALHDVLSIWLSQQDSSLDPATQRPNTDFSKVAEAISCARELLQNSPPTTSIDADLLELMAPADQPEELVLYVLPTIGRDVEQDPTDFPAPRSLAAVWAESIRNDASVEAMRNTIVKRKSVQKENAEILLATLAIRAADTASATTHLQAMLHDGSTHAPPLADITGLLDALQPWTKTIQAMRRSEQVCRQADRWLIPLSIESDTPELQNEIDRALLRVAAMLILDGGAKQQAQSQIQAILEMVAKRTSDESLRQLANEMLKRI